MNWYSYNDELKPIPINIKGDDKAISCITGKDGKVGLVFSTNTHRENKALDVTVSNNYFYIVNDSLNIMQLIKMKQIFIIDYYSNKNLYYKNIYLIKIYVFCVYALQFNIY